ncbi:MAG: hypothetical protein N3B12_05170 [Armatimonadetes bacterium]|nr:hypothetical protein [Armatimonadota bacterium]
MPRLFYKTIVVLAFVVACVAMFGAEVLAAAWLVGRYPSILAWLFFTMLLLIDVPITMALWSATKEWVRRA